MATYGSIGEFNAAVEPWDRYIDRSNEANEISDGSRQRAMLNAVVSPTIYALFCKLLAPRKPKYRYFQVITDAMLKHSVPSTSVIVEHYKLNTRLRHSGETISTFLAKLRGLAEKCDYGGISRDRFVCGLKNDHITRSLLTQGDKVTFEKAVERALTYQLAGKYARNVTPRYSYYY